MAGVNLPVEAIRQQIASAVNLIVQINRQKDGSRKIVEITEVVGNIEGTTISIATDFQVYIRWR
jgi:pilus assembly protein CpaF